MLILEENITNIKKKKTKTSMLTFTESNVDVPFEEHKFDN